MEIENNAVYVEVFSFQKLITHIKIIKKLHSDKSPCVVNVHYTNSDLRRPEIWKYFSFHSVCFYVGVVWLLKAEANSSSYNETSPVLISYLSTNSGSGSGGSLCLIASLKSHKAV